MGRLIVDDMGDDEVELVRTLATAALNYARKSDALDAAHRGIPRRFSDDELRTLVNERDAARSEYRVAFNAAAARD